MKITKFEHACITVEEDGQSLIIDPGAYTKDLVIPDNVVAIVVTHVHQDHIDKQLLATITSKNPEALILAPEQVVKELEGFNTQQVIPNEGIKVGSFELEFLGGQHALIVKDWPIDQNLGVMINTSLYYPGDSFTTPDRTVDILALPVSAPWLKFDEVADFLMSVKPKIAFPTHDAILSDLGKATVDRWSSSIAEKTGTKYQRLTEPLII